MSNKSELVLNELLERAGEANPRPRIEPVQRLIGFLGDPQLDFEIIHVGGTNGKTSTSRAIEVLLRAHGIKTGLLTSPHLVSFSERIQIDGEPISEDALFAAWQEMQPALNLIDEQLQAEGQSRITFFEALVALGLVAFADAPIEVAVIEVGMGGEWDATNIVNSKVSVFTPIDIDHTDFLGTTIAEIAATKSKIIKPQSLVVSAVQRPEALEVIRAEATAQGAKLFSLGDDFSLETDIGAVGGRMFSATGIAGNSYQDILLPLFGRHQSQNALVAIAAVEAFFGAQRAIEDDVLEIGFSNLISPGRLQPLSNEPPVFVDAAHNPHGAKALVDAVKDHFNFDEILLVTGVFQDKDTAGVLEALTSIADSVYVTKINSERSADPADLKAIIQEIDAGIPVEEFENSVDALSEARAYALEREGAMVLIAGSVYLAGEAIEFAAKEGWQL